METKQELIRDEMSDKIIAAAEIMVTSDGAQNITVRKVLQELGITNRVFYNRFHNIDEVLEIIYENTILKIRDSISDGIDRNKDFFEQVMGIVEKTLTMSYINKMKFNNYIFQNDSISGNNYKWWCAKIKDIIEYAKMKNYIRDVDSDIMSYSIWCFIRGFNADAVSRNLPMEDAVRTFRYSFGILIDGMRIKDAGRGNSV
ncbi:MAG: TetR/AcrR family transcriptional regulator [Clostridia bacterium]|nr:TetR/AcrR family transcriptional regulator [Clostridia bacterium]